MTRQAEKTRKRPAGHRPSKQTAYRRISAHPEVEERWDAFSTEVRFKVGEAERKKYDLAAISAADLQDAQATTRNKQPSRKVVQCPYEKPDSVLKREVYKFVQDNRLWNRFDRFKNVLSREISGERPLRVSFKVNPYHWFLMALKSEGIVLNLTDVTRYSRQLVYAGRHKVPVQFLIGFLYQTGSPAMISKKMLDPAKREDWYVELRNSSEVQESTPYEEYKF